MRIRGFRISCTLLILAFLVMFLPVPPHLSNYKPALAISFTLGFLLRRLSLAWIPVLLAALPAHLLGRVSFSDYADLAPSYLMHIPVYWLGMRSAAFGQHGPARAWLPPILGAMASALLFYLVTNTISWQLNPAYTKNISGWVQSLTVGEPGYPPTWMFLRNSLVSTVLWSALILYPAIHSVRRSASPAAAVPCG